VLVFCPKTAMAQGPVRIGLLENDRVRVLEVRLKRYRQQGPCVRSSNVGDSYMFELIK
jgi:hypothetical protein